MTKRMLWKDIRSTFKKSRGRYFSIVALLALGAFALVGLKVAGPDMRATSGDYFADYDMMDLAVIGDLGIDKDDEADIEQLEGVRAVGYGYLVDATIKGTNSAVRVESTPDKVSRYELADGRMPKSEDEIAIDSFMADDYPVGSKITFVQKKNADGSKTLKRSTFTVVGHVKSMEIIAGINMGKTTVGTGDLMGYAVVSPKVFSTDYRMIARLTFDDTQGLEPYSAEYLDKIAVHKKELKKLLKNAPERRLAVVRDTYDEKIADGEQQVADVRQKLSDAKAALDDAASQLADGKGQLASSWDKLEQAALQLTSARTQLADGASQLSAAQATLASSRSQLDSGWDEYNDGVAALAAAKSDAESQIAQAQSTIDASRKKLDDGKAAYEDGIAKLKDGVKQYEDGIAKLDAGLDQCGQGIAAVEQRLAAPGLTGEQRSQLEAQKAQLEAQKTQLVQQKAAAVQQHDALSQQLSQTKAAYERFMSTDADANTEGDDGGYTALVGQLDAAQKQLDQKQAAANKEIASKESQLASAKSQLETGETAYQQGVATYNAKKAEYEAGVAEYNQGLASYSSGLATYNEAAGTLASKQSEYEDGLAEYNEQLPDAEAKIAEAERKLDDARAQRDKLEVPTYAVDTRRETPGSDGYRTYDSVSEIVDSLANIFPYFLYLVAALVASTTMTRMVDEERINAGTLKALGYDDADIMKKFVVYGASAGAIGSVIGIVLGHTLLPYIVYSAYGAKFSLPPIVLQWHGGVALAALALGLAVAVVPAVLVARRMLAEQPAQLLLPKAPTAGSKIFLEHIKPLRSRLTFTQKVTFRNLLRYKKRMLMTVIGVSGAVCLMFCGYAVRNSIDGLSETQFGDIIGYDLIVAENAGTSKAERKEVAEELKSGRVTDYSSIAYESVTKAAGDKGDDQSINLLVPMDRETFSKYLDIRDRKTGEALPLEDDGAVISERLATLTGTRVGDTMTFTDASGVKRKVRITGICEMYMEHFMFMSPKAYQTCFGKAATGNAYVAKLKDSSIEGTRAEAARFMKLDGVLGCVQSATLINQINVIVTSLNKIMLVLIVVAILLAVVIVYNLVTINVAERIRELSTVKVLGFFDNEVSMYIYRETIINAAIALPVGWGLGWLLQQYIITAVPPENVMFDPACGWLPFVVSTVVVVVVVAVMYAVVNHRLKNVDMLEALKSVD